MMFLSIPLCMVLFILGGQVNKLFRPIGVPLVFVGLAFLTKETPWWGILPSLLYGFTLTIGYGENSKLMKWLKDEELVRSAEGLLQAIPILLTCLILQHWFMIFYSLLPMIAYQIREGSFGKIGKYDILPDDMIRGWSIALGISLALLK